VTTIGYAILAFLLQGPLSGYDIKKRFMESESLHWTGNNNQVYRTLIQLHADGLVVQEVQQPREGPARKVYSLTRAGEAALRDWVQQEPALPDSRHSFIVRLMAADVLTGEELDRLIVAYDEQIRMRLLMLEERERRGRHPGYGSERQRELWRLINDHPAALLRAEREWLLTVQWAIQRHSASRRGPP
jgi:PadR family transcriptional regulator AphA